MEQTQVLLALIGAAGVGILAALVILRRQRRATMPQSSPFAVSTEGEKRCPHCGMGNMWTDARCVSCGRPLAG